MSSDALLQTYAKSGNDRDFTRIFGCRGIRTTPALLLRNELFYRSQPVW